MGYETRGLKQVKAEIEGGVTTRVEPTLAESVRRLPEGKAMFIPVSEDDIMRTQKRVSANAAVQKRNTGNNYGTMIDRARGGIWVTNAGPVN